MSEKIIRNLLRALRGEISPGAIQCLGVDGLQEGPVTYSSNGRCFHAARGVEVYTEDNAVGRVEVTLSPPHPNAFWRDGEWWVEKRGKRVALGWERPAQKVE